MAKKTGFYLETADFDKNFNELIRSVSHEVAAQGLFSAAHALLNAADDEIPQTPQKTGDLRASRRVEDPVIGFDKVSVRAGYNSPYAAYQHEGERKDHSHKVENYTKTIVPGPGPKFLEKKMAGNSQRFMAIVADHIRRKLGGSPR